MTKPDTALYLGATSEEITRLTTHGKAAAGIGWLRRAGDETIIADLGVYEVAGATLNAPGQQRLLYDYAHELRNEISRRDLWLKMPPSRRIPRCEVCRHGAERLFKTTATTHDIVDSNDETKKIYPNLCARCWSRLHKESEETE